MRIYFLSINNLINYCQLLLKYLFLLTNTIKLKKNMRKLIFIGYSLPFLLSFIFAVAYSPTLYANESFKRLSIENGLAHTDANCVAQDSTGLIWIATNAGLQSYDGYSLVLYDYYADSTQKVYQAHNRIQSMTCGRRYMWLNSDSGLTCFDLQTHLYIPYRTENIDKKLLNTPIKGINIADGSFLWINTIDGIYVAHIDEANHTLRFLDWEHKSEKDKVGITFRQCTQGSYLWVNNTSSLIQLEIHKNRIRIKNHYPIIQLCHGNPPINAIFYSFGHLYLSYPEGCSRIRTSINGLNTASLQSITFKQIDPTATFKTRRAFIVDKNENLWCAYSGGVLQVKHPFSPNAAIYTYLQNNRDSNLSITKANSLFIDCYNNLWVSVMDTGAYYCSLSPKKFSTIPKEKFQELGFSRSGIAAIEKKNDGTLWILADGGLICYDTHSEKMTHIPLVKSKAPTPFFQTLKFDTDQKILYIGLSEGVITYNSETRKSSYITDSNGILPQLHNQSISRINIDKYNRIWIACWGGGVYCLDKDFMQNKKYIHLGTDSPYYLSSNLVLDICINKNDVFLATENGISRVLMDESGALKKAVIYQADEKKAHSMSSNYIATIDQQNDSVLWIGTIGGGLNKVTLHSLRNNDYSAECITTKDGLTSNDVEIAFIDQSQNVWIGGKGITKIDTQNQKVSIFESVDGLQSNSFKVGAGYKDKNGFIYMGGIDGINYFSPAQIRDKEYKADLIFTDFYIHNKAIKVDTTNEKEPILRKILNETKHIHLHHDQNNFQLSFSLLGYNLSNRVMYRYRMNGYDKQWQVIPYTQNKAFYSNLSYGNYSFEVQVSTDRGFSWQEPGKSIYLTISPPWWWTIWAKIAYVILALLIVFILLYQYIKELKLQKENQIQKMKRMTEEEKYQSKLQFFMNISHELKTPLTLIMLAAEHIANIQLTKECRAIISNSKKMLALITELVDIRKADLGIKQLTLSFENVTVLVEQLFQEISPWAEEKQIQITCQTVDSNIQMDCDREKLIKLIMNLLTNAIKYTEQGGNIRLSLKKGRYNDITTVYPTKYQEGKVSEEEDLCIITVEDSGIGISAESIQSIYERFFQVKSSNYAHLGSGIGLAIAKNMALLHQGCIIVSSERTVGTEFVVALPIRTETKDQKQPETSNFDSKEFIDNQYLEYVTFEMIEEEKEESKLNKKETTSNLPTLLIVEDNVEMLNTLKNHFKSSYQVVTAENGRIGLEICHSIYPDIILSDVMMPEMDGIEMCTKIRNNFSVAYIPIILLTAKSEVENQIEGYESGADLYMPKPFSIKLLEINLKRLLSYKEKIFKHSTSPIPSPQSTSERNIFVEKENQDFESKLRNVIETNITNPELSVDMLCKEMMIGRTRLYTKVKEVCNQALADYIRNIRLEKAEYLMLHSAMNIQEIMFEVGFVNGSHFAKVFKLKYGVTPSEYIKKNITD